MLSRVSVLYFSAHTANAIFLVNLAPKIFLIRNLIISFDVKEELLA